MQTCHDIEGEFGVVQLQSGWRFATFHNRRQNMDSLQHTKDQVAIERGLDSLPEKTKMGLPDSKVMATGFQDALAIIHIDYF